MTKANSIYELMHGLCVLPGGPKVIKPYRDVHLQNYIIWQRGSGMRGVERGRDGNWGIGISPGHNQNWICSSCNLIGSDAEPKHWLDRERTKFQINFSCKKDRMLVGLP